MLRSMFVVAFCFVSLLVVSGQLIAADDLTCLREGERASSSFYAHLQQEAYAALERRTKNFEQLKTPEQIGEYQRQLRELFVRQLGGFPERTPLNAQVVRKLDANGYRIENVIFESRPGHHITANLYIPDGAGPFPGVVVSSGHSRTAKTADYNQRFAIAMAVNGMAALSIDPIGQGERSQILNDQGEPQFSGTTTEHFLVGVGSILVGRNTAGYRAWDAIRAIDYLCSRPEIDPNQIGMTGCSGGGTMTSYVMALDERVTCAAPACYLTTMRRLIETIGPQDAEQNIFGQIAHGLDQPDYVVMRAPRATLISSTTEDFFDIHGSWDNYRQAKRIYGRLGFPERVDLVEIEGKHGVQPQNLATIAHWMQRWMLGRDKVIPAAELKTHPASDLLCTESGQVLRLPGERSVFDINAEYETQLAAERKKKWSSTSGESILPKVRELAGIGVLEQITAPRVEQHERVERDGYQIERVVLRGHSAVPLPALVFRPQSATKDVYLYVHDEGKAGDAAPGGPIEKLVRAGNTVVAVDLRGQGETGTGKRDSLLGDYKTYYLSYLLGKSLTGQRTEDILTATLFAASLASSDQKSAPQVHVVGVGQTGIAALHAAACRPDSFASLTLRNTPRDWSSLVKKSVPAAALEGTVHGALMWYDLPDLVRLAGPAKVRYEP